MCKMVVVKLLGIFVLFEILCVSGVVEEIFTWNYVDYKNLPQPEDSYIIPEEPYYAKGNTNVQGISYHAPTGLFIVTVARVKKGVPSTVNAFCADNYEKGSNTPKVWGFPSYEMNEIKAEYFDMAKRRSVRSKNIGNHNQTQNTHNTNKPHHNYSTFVKPTTHNTIIPSNSTSYTYSLHNKLNKLYHSQTMRNNQKNQSLSKIHSIHLSKHKETFYVPLPYKESDISTKSPVKKPYNNYPSTPEEHIISVYHPVVDTVCDRVWILDTGALDYPEGDIIIYPASIWIIDIPLNGKCGVGPYRVRKRYEIPRTVVSVVAGITNVALDYKKGGTCNDVFAYFANTFSGKINVYDYKNDKSWSFLDHYSFFPVIKTSTYELDGEEFTDEFGVFSITLGWRNVNGYRTAYYISPTTTIQFGVSTEVLQQEDLSPTKYNPDDFRSIGNRGCDTQAVVHVFDSKNGIIFYGDRNELWCRESAFVM
ncbi:hypothetical protein DMENIID0001_053460 [Sergentomyia squamirostris]